MLGAKDVRRAGSALYLRWLCPAVRLTAPHRRSPSMVRNFVVVEGFPFWL
jgi:hypothetical protein